MPTRSPATVRRLERNMGTLASAAIARMDEVLPWYRAMPAENRSWVNLVAQAGVAAFVEWFRQPDAPQAISADVFGTAPRELTRTVTLQQTVELVRVVIAVVEEQIEQIAPGDEDVVREAVLRYSREIAFAAAQVYAQAAEARGAWDARLESLVVDAVLRGEAAHALRSPAAAPRWGPHSGGRCPRLGLPVGRRRPGRVDAGGHRRAGRRGVAAAGPSARRRRPRRGAGRALGRRPRRSGAAAGDRGHARALLRPRCAGGRPRRPAPVRRRQVRPRGVVRTG